MLVVFLLFVDLTHESGDGGFLEIPRPPLSYINDIKDKKYIKSQISFDHICHR